MVMTSGVRGAECQELGSVRVVTPVGVTIRKLECPTHWMVTPPGEAAGMARAAGTTVDISMGK
jgi:hypothetical protein